MDNTEELFGFKNLGNICFMSCFLQLLLSSKIIRETLKTIRFEIDPVTSIVIPNLGILFEDPSSNRREISITMRNYLEYITRIKKMEHYSANDQYDIGEFAVIFFDICSKYFEQTFFEDKYFRRLPNPDGDVGYFEKQGVFTILVLSLTTDFHRSMSEYQLYNVLGDETLDDAIYFSKRFTSLPKVLFIQLSRFDAMGNKNSSKMQMYEHIYMIENEIQIPYRLRSIGIHLGSTQGGHYIANRRVGNKWYEIDDESVKKIKDPNLTTGYFYVYERESSESFEISDDSLMLTKIIPSLEEKEFFDGRLSKIENLCKEKKISELEIMHKREDFIGIILDRDEDRIFEFLELFVSTQESITDLFFVEIMTRLPELILTNICSRIRSNFLERFQEDLFTRNRLSEESKHFRHLKSEGESKEPEENDYEKIEYYYSLMYNCIISKRE